MKLCKIEELRYEEIEALQLFLRKVVLGYFHIILRDIVALEVGHAYKRLLAIHTLIDNFCGSVFMNSIVKFVLNRSAKRTFCG